MDIVGKRVGLLEDHADVPAGLGELAVRAVDVRPVEQDVAGHRGAGMSWCIRLRMRRKVDLPQPDGPMSAVTCRDSHGQRDPVEHQVVAEPRRDVARLERGGLKLVIQR